MSVPTEPTAGAKITPSSPRVGAIEAVVWGLKRLVNSPILVVVAVISGGLSAVTAGTGIGEPLSVASGAATLFLSAVTYRHPGLAFGDVEDTRDLFVGALWAIPRMIGGYVLLVGGMFLLVLVLALAGVIGALLAIPAIALFLIHTALIFPAVCLDEGLVNAGFKAWDLARGSRLTIFGVLLLTGIPIAVFEAVLANATTVQQAVFGILAGVSWTATNLAVARIYVDLR